MEKITSSSFYYDDWTEETELCFLFSRGEKCPYGNKCNYAHGENKLKHTTPEEMKKANLISDVGSYHYLKYMEVYLDAAYDARSYPEIVKKKELNQPLCSYFTSPVQVDENNAFPKFYKSDAERDFIKGTIQDNSIFGGVGKEEMSVLLDAFESTSFDKGTTIIKEGEIVDYLYIIGDGKVEFTVASERTGEVGKGEIFGDLNILYDCPRAATCVAVEPCQLWRVDQTTFKQILNGRLNGDDQRSTKDCKQLYSDSRSSRNFYSSSYSTYNSAYEGNAYAYSQLMSERRMNGHDQRSARDWKQSHLNSRSSRNFYSDAYYNPVCEGADSQFMNERRMNGHEQRGTRDWYFNETRPHLKADMKSKDTLLEYMSKESMDPTRLIRDYVHAIDSGEGGANIDEEMTKLLESNPSYDEINGILKNENLPDHHLRQLKEYNSNLLEEQLKAFTERLEKKRLMRSTITVVGRGRDGKTSTINSLKGLPFQPYCDSTKGTRISEVDVCVTKSSDILLQAKDTKTSSVNDESKQLSFHEELCKKLEQLVEDKVDSNDDSNDKFSFTIFDHCGQRVFRPVQNLLMSREGVFIVVFDLLKILDKETREDALEHLDYWLSSIKLEACKEGSNDSTDNLIKYPPVILVGTHFDEFLKLKNKNDLKSINSTLVENLSHIGLIPGLESDLYNKDQDLCFWPIDNSDPRDENVFRLRELVYHTENNSNVAKDDKGSDIAKEIPVSMIKFMDKLTEIAKEQPVIAITSENMDTVSIMQVMSDCGVFDGQSFGKREKVEICKKLLKQFHSIGHFLYFHQFPALQEHCILDIQWMIDMITFVIRDFGMHRFHNDYDAMRLDSGKYWKQLVFNGILDKKLLQQFWLGQEEHFEFLILLFSKLGFFGELQKQSESLYSVPTAITIETKRASVLSKPSIEEYLNLSLDDPDPVISKVKSCGQRNRRRFTHTSIGELSMQPQLKRKRFIIPKE